MHNTFILALLLSANVEVENATATAVSARESANDCAGRCCDRSSTTGEGLLSFCSNDESSSENPDVPRDEGRHFAFLGRTAAPGAVQNDRMSILRAESWLALRKFDRSKKELGSIETNSPCFSDALTLQAKAELWSGNPRSACDITRRIAELDKSNVEAQLILARAQMALGNMRESDRVIDAALALAPDHADLRRLRWMRLVEQGRYTIDVARRTIRTDVNELAALRQGVAEPSNDELQAAGNELATIIRKRQMLQSVLSDDDEVANWLRLRLAGGAGFGHIRWRDMPDLPFILKGWHRPRAAGNSVEIYIAGQREDEDGKRRDATLDEALSSLVFEMFNIENGSAFQQLNAKAKRGDLDRDDYCFLIAQQEFVAKHKVWAWYVKVYWPWANRNGIRTDVRSWPYDLANTAEEQSMEKWDRDGYPFFFYGRKFDLLTGHVESEDPAIKEKEEKLRRAMEESRRVKEELEELSRRLRGD